MKVFFSHTLQVLFAPQLTAPVNTAANISTAMEFISELLSIQKLHCSQTTIQSKTFYFPSVYCAVLTSRLL